MKFADARSAISLRSDARKLTATRALAIMAFIIGLLMIYGGGGHLIAVIASKVTQGKPYDFRFASLITNGAILLLAGLTHISVSRRIWQGSSAAIQASGVAAAAVMAYCIILLPVASARDAALPALVLNVAYSAALVATARAVNKRRRRAMTSAA